VLADPPFRAALLSARRLEILRLTWLEERQAGDIRRAMPDVTWGAVSLQIRSLVDAGLLESRSSGRERFYRADRTKLASVADLLERTWADALWRLKLAAELEASRRGPRPARPSTRTRRRRIKVESQTPKKPKRRRR
jgi:DNA-binding transcriptional ArsR family regulator